MKTNELIEKLSRELTPVHPLPGALLSSFQLFGLITLLALLSVPFVTLRSDLQQSIGSGVWFSLGAILLIASFLFCCVTSFSSIPGRSDFRLYFGAGTLSLAACFLVLIFSGMHSPIESFPGGFSSSGVHCTLFAILFSLLPLAGTFWFLKRRAPVRLGLTGISAGVMTSLFSGFALQFFCESSNPVHIANWHLILPLLLCALFSALLARLMIKW